MESAACPSTRHLPPRVALAVLAITVVAALGAWALTGGGGGGRSVSVRTGSLLPAMFGLAPTAPQLERAFVDHGVRLYRSDATVLQPRFAPIRAYTVAMWRPAGAAHMLIGLLGPRPDRAIERFENGFGPAGVSRSELSGRVWIEYGSVRPALALRIRAALAELHRIAAPA